MSADENADEDNMPSVVERDIGVTLSGGGHRATVFGLGALLAIADAGLRDRVVSISSVSGGSIANGSVMVGPDFGTADSAAIDDHIAQVVQAIAQRGVLQGGAPATRWYLTSFIASVALTAVAFVVAVVAALAKWPLVFAISGAAWVAFVALAWWLFSQRSAATERAIDIELLGNRHTTLAEQNARNLSVHHVICTTELQAGTTFYFSNRMVYGWEFGGTTAPSNVRLSTPVQASACVPGAFRPRTIGLDELNLVEIASAVAAQRGRPGRTVKRVVLEDGGVYDNMADEWEYGFSNRGSNWAALTDAQPAGAKQLIVVNASADWAGLKPMTSHGLRFELDGLLRSKDVQYDVSTSHRRRALAQIFLGAAATGGTGGAFVQIKDNPYRLLGMFEPKPGDPPTDMGRWAGEARAFLDAYGVSEEQWDQKAKVSAVVPTTLKPLGAEVCASLLEHAYMLTTANMHVIFGQSGLPRTVDRARFERLAGVADRA